MNDEASEQRDFEAWVAEVGSGSTIQYGLRLEWEAYRRGRADQRRATALELDELWSIVHGNGEHEGQGWWAATGRADCPAQECRQLRTLVLADKETAPA
jgi:hypothetical protein